jgi:vomeronasal 2 receptor
MQINKCVSALIYNISSSYYKISEEFHHEGDVMIGAFFPLHTFHTRKEKPHSTIPYYYLDNKIQ